MSEATRHFLIVDDSAGDTRLFSECLRSMKISYSLTIATDGDEALEMIHKRGKHRAVPRPDLIFLDINMPRKNGFDVLKLLRRDADHQIQSTPIIMFTSSSQPDDVRMAYSCGAISFVKKPLDLEGYCRVIEATESFWFDTAEIPPYGNTPVAEA